jgi:hypothetical protein
MDFSDEFHKIISPLEVILIQKERICKLHCYETLNLVHKSLQVCKLGLGDCICSTYLALKRLMNVPEDICLDDIQATSLGFCYEVWPHLLIYCTLV